MCLWNRDIGFPSSPVRGRNDDISLDFRETGCSFLGGEIVGLHQLPLQLRGRSEMLQTFQHATAAPSTDTVTHARLANGHMDLVRRAQDRRTRLDLAILPQG